MVTPATNKTVYSYSNNNFYLLFQWAVAQCCVVGNAGTKLKVTGLFPKYRKKKLDKANRDQSGHVYMVWTPNTKKINKLLPDTQRHSERFNRFKKKTSDSSPAANANPAANAVKQAKVHETWVYGADVIENTHGRGALTALGRLDPYRFSWVQTTTTINTHLENMVKSYCWPRMSNEIPFLRNYRSAEETRANGQRVLDLCFFG